MVQARTEVTRVLSGLGVVSVSFSLIILLLGTQVLCITMTGLAILSALTTFFFIKPLTTDGMALEDAEVRNNIWFLAIFD